MYRIHYSHVVILFLIGLFTGPGLLAQPVPEHTGLSQITSWPHSIGDIDHQRGSSPEFFVAIDTLKLGYGFRVVNDAPLLSVVVEWKQGAYGFFNGIRLRSDEMPVDVRIAGAVFIADVYVQDSMVTSLTFALDDMMLGPVPDLIAVDIWPESWDHLFESTPGDVARRYFEEGFELRDLRFASVAFAGSEDWAKVEITDLILSTWPHFAPNNPPRTKNGKPRKETIGRDGNKSSGEKRGSGRARNEGERDEKKSPDEKKKSKDENERDEENELLPATLAAVAAVGILAYAGGTIGYSGNARHTPIGLASGIVGRHGGFLIQASINAAIFEDSGDTEKLLLRSTGFFDLFRSPIQPMIGAGALLRGQDGSVNARPVVSLGLAGNFGTMILLGGYDLLEGGIEFGMVFNFRATSR